MGHEPYPYRHSRLQSYSFTSEGKYKIEKEVVFVAAPIANGFNLVFGDLLPDGGINDIANSNNGDIIKVLATVIHILKDFTLQCPGAKVIFRGSTEIRMRLYMRIVRTYYHTYNKDFMISFLTDRDGIHEEVPFDPDLEAIILGIIVKRKS